MMYERLVIPMPQTAIDDELTQKLTLFNASIDQLENRAARHDEAESQLLENLAEITPNELRQQRDQLQNDSFDLANEALALIAQRRHLLTDAAEAIEGRLPELEEAIEAARTKADKALRKAGYGPGRHADYATQRTIRDRQHRFKINETEPVLNALRQTMVAKTELHNYQTWQETCEQLDKAVQADRHGVARQILGIRVQSNAVKRPRSPRRVPPLTV